MSNSGSASGSAILEAKQTFNTLQELSKLLNTGLDSESLALAVRLCEQVTLLHSLKTFVVVQASFHRILLILLEFSQETVQT